VDFPARHHVPLGKSERECLYPSYYSRSFAFIFYLTPALFNLPHPLLSSLLRVVVSTGLVNEAALSEITAGGDGGGWVGGVPEPELVRQTSIQAP
jgi:hypothetical protein